MKLIDKEINNKLLKLILHDNYELKYYTFFALQNNAVESLKNVLENSLNDPDPLIRKMAVRGLLNVGNEQSLSIFKKVLFKETNQLVIGELTKAIYNLKNPVDHARLLLEIKSYRNENGMISDESDKWYHDPDIYHTFSEAEDPENICFSLIMEKIKNISIRNPIDIASGTGRMIWQILDKLSFFGTMYAVDSSKQMCSFIKKTIKRERRYTNKIKVVNTTIEKISDGIIDKSTFIIRSFGFPSRISDISLCKKRTSRNKQAIRQGWRFYYYRLGRDIQ